MTLADLSNVKGIGRQKLEAYGVAVTTLVKQFLERQPESRPFVSTMVRDGTPTRRKVNHTIEETYRLWQQGKTPDEIARVRELARSTVLGHLEVLILKGRTVDISRIVPAERAALIQEALTRVQEDRLSSVKEILQDAATYDEIRLVRAAAQQLRQKSR